MGLVLALLITLAILVFNIIAYYDGRIRQHRFAVMLANNVSILSIVGVFLIADSSKLSISSLNLLLVTGLGLFVAISAKEHFERKLTQKQSEQDKRAIEKIPFSSLYAQAQDYNQETLIKISHEINIEREKLLHQVLDEILSLLHSKFSSDFRLSIVKPLPDGTMLALATKNVTIDHIIFKRAFHWGRKVQGVAGKCATELKPIVIRDLEDKNDPNISYWITTTEAECGGVIAIPVIRYSNKISENTQCLAVLSITATEKNIFSVELVELLEPFIKRLGNIMLDKKSTFLVSVENSLSSSYDNPVKETINDYPTNDGREHKEKEGVPDYWFISVQIAEEREPGTLILGRYTDEDRFEPHIDLCRYKGVEEYLLPKHIFINTEKMIFKVHPNATRTYHKGRTVEPNQEYNLLSGDTFKIGNVEIYFEFIPKIHMQGKIARTAFIEHYETTEGNLPKIEELTKLEEVEGVQERFPVWIIKRAKELSAETGCSSKRALELVISDIEAERNKTIAKENTSIKAMLLSYYH
ncbi:MAG: hypothetical protein KJ064_17750 [Anaerolineae bacterium]|nr:hypothetical protein [Anaerolineae bacterium]